MKDTNGKSTKEHSISEHCPQTSAGEKDSAHGNINNKHQKRNEINQN